MSAEELHNELAVESRPRRPLFIPWIVMAVIGLIIVGFGIALAKAGLQQVESGPAPNFALTTFDGNRFTLSDQRGKVVLVNFWASWCGPCRSEAPILNALWDEYKSKGVVFIGVDYLDNRSDASSFMSEFAMRYPTAPDEGTRVSGDYRVKGVPETYVIDKQGNLAYTYLLPLDPDGVKQLRALLDKLLIS